MPSRTRKCSASSGSHPGSPSQYPKRIVVWSPQARAELRAADRETAVRILKAIDRYLTTGAGDVKRLRPPRLELRLRVGDYSIFFQPQEELAIEGPRVLHRREACR